MLGDLEDKEQICVFIYFLFEFQKMPESSISNYINCIPKDETCFPIFYSEENKKLLQGSFFISYINKNMKKLKLEFESLKRIFPELINMDFKQYLKVRLTLGARVFETDKANKVTSAIPIADLFNYHPEKVNCCWKVDSKNNFNVQATRDIKENEEVNKNFFPFYSIKNIKNMQNNQY